MSQNLDKNKILASIQKTRPQDLLYLTINPVDKDSKKKVFVSIEKFVGNDRFDVILIKYNNN